MSGDLKRTLRWLELNLKLHYICLSEKIGLYSNCACPLLYTVSAKIHLLPISVDCTFILHIRLWFAINSSFSCRVSICIQVYSMWLCVCLDACVCLCRTHVHHSILIQTNYCLYSSYSHTFSFTLILLIPWC